MASNAPKINDNPSVQPSDEVPSSSNMWQEVGHFLYETGHSAAYTGIQSPINGVLQIADAISGTTITKKAQFISNPTNKGKDSDPVAHEIGAALGQIPWFIALHKMASAGVSRYGLAKPANFNRAMRTVQFAVKEAEEGMRHRGLYFNDTMPVIERLLETAPSLKSAYAFKHDFIASGLTGITYGALFTPTDLNEHSLLGGRIQSGVNLGLGLMTCSARSSFPPLNLDKLPLKNVTDKKMMLGALIGIPAGLGYSIVSTNFNTMGTTLDGLSNTDKKSHHIDMMSYLPTAGEIGKNILTFAIINAGCAPFASPFKSSVARFLPR